MALKADRRRRTGDCSGFAAVFFQRDSCAVTLGIESLWALRLVRSLRHVCNRQFGLAAVLAQANVQPHRARLLVGPDFDDLA